MDAHSTFNNFDYIVIGIVLFSGLLALMRGFVREVLSLAGWIGAYFAAAKYYTLAEPWAHHYFKQQQVATAVAAAGIFIIALIFFAILSFLISRLIRGQALTAIDRTLGFVFGVLRGALVVCIIYLAAVAILWPDIEAHARDKAQQAQTDSSEAQQKPYAPDWLLEAKTRPALAIGADVLASVLPKDLVEKQLSSYKEQKATAEKLIKEKTMESLSVPGTESQPAYQEKDRTNLNNLLNEKAPQ